MVSSALSLVRNGSDRGEVALATSRVDAGLDQFAHPVEDRNRLGFDDGADPGGDCYLPQMSEEPEAGDIGGGVRLRFSASGRRLAALRVVMVVDRGLGEFGWAHPSLQRRRDDAHAEWLGEDQTVAGAGAGIGDDAIAGYEPGDGKPVLGLGVVDGMATEDGGAALRHDVGAAPKDFAQEVEGEPFARPADQLQSRDG